MNQDNMKVRRAWINRATGSQRQQKALSAAIWLKHILPTSRLEHFSIGKLSRLSGISYRALKERLDIMLKNGYIHFEGTERNTVLVINKMTSKRHNRNVSIDSFDLTSYKTTYQSLRDLIAAKVQATKDNIRHLLQIFHNPSKSTNYRAVRRKVRHLVQCGVLKSMHDEYKEWGISLKRFAEKLGCCVRTAQKVVNDTVNRGWMTKTHNFEQVFAPCTFFIPVEGYTFTTKHNLYIVHANTYALSPTLSSALTWTGNY